MSNVLNRWLLSAFGAVICLAAGTTARADETTYTPPATKGEIYVVVDWPTPYGNPMDAKTSVTWGGWNKAETVKLKILNGTVPKGFVLKLQHRKDDAIPLTIKTAGRIVSSPQQGPAPAQWSAREYKQVSW